MNPLVRALGNTVISLADAVEDPDGSLVAEAELPDQLHRSVWEFDLDDEAAVQLMDRIGEADYRITTGANEQLQLEALLASLARGR